MTIHIREMRNDDLRPVLALCKAFFAEYEAHHEDFFDTFELRDDQLSGRFLESITSDSSSTLVAFASDTLVAYASIKIRSQPEFYKAGRIGSISGLMVAPEFRRQGIATMLLAEARKWFRERGVKYFTVYTATANDPALQFYRRSSMQPLQTTLIGEA